MSGDETFFVPLSELHPSPENVRKAEPAAEGIRELAASIHSHGLLMPLLVTERPAGGYFVEAGERRRRALHHLMTEGFVSPAQPVWCAVIDESDAAELSLTENLMREALSPADEITAFAALTERGRSPEGIAQAFGRTQRHVRSRLALAHAHPDLLVELRAGTMSVEQLTALCATDDTALQLRVWKEASGWERRPEQLRRLVLRGEVPSHDPRVRFVGLDAYRAAGGDLREDLFASADDAAILSDAGLLNRLVAQKVADEAERIRTDEGWSWSEAWDGPNWSRLHDFMTLRPKRRDFTDTEAARVHQLQQRQDALLELVDTGELDDEQDGELSAVEQELEALRNGLMEYGPSQRASAGVVVWWDDGRVHVRRGLRRPKETKAATGTTTGDSGDAAPAPGLPEKVRLSLLGYRNRYAQLQMLEHPHAARILLCTWILRDVLEQANHGINVPLSIRPPHDGIREPLGFRLLGARQAELNDAFDAGLDGLLAGLDPNWALPAVWTWLEQRTEAQLDRIIAWGVANRLSLDDEHEGLTECVLEAMTFDMAEHYTAAVDDFWEHVPKAMMLEIATEISGAEVVKRQRLAGMKKTELAAYCASTYDWCPPLVATPGSIHTDEPDARVKAPKKKAPRKKRTRAKGAAS